MHFVVMIWTSRVKISTILHMLARGPSRKEKSNCLWNAVHQLQSFYLTINLEMLNLLTIPTIPTEIINHVWNVFHLNFGRIPSNGSILICLLIWFYKKIKTRNLEEGNLPLPMFKSLRRCWNPFVTRNMHLRGENLSQLIP